MKLWSNISSYEAGRGGLKNWMMVIARNTAVSYARKKRNGDAELHESHGSAESPEDRAVLDSQLEELRDAIEKLGHSERQLIYRRYFYMQEVQQIAAELGTTSRAIESRLFRLRKKLRRLIGCLLYTS